jgi:pimeloyl-ACP methyl ester carboxylesterase/DNA-binding CsgD family transcriptional regulator
MTLPAKTFLARFRDAAKSGVAIEAIAADTGGFAAASASAPDDLNAAVTAASSGASGPAMLIDEAIASAACTLAGQLVAADDAFLSLPLATATLAAATTDIGNRESTFSLTLTGADGRPIALAFAPWPRAATWPLAPHVRASLESGRATIAVLGVRPRQDDARRRWATAWALTPAEARIAFAVVDHGDLRRAAAAVAVAYETAREAMAGAMAKTGARRQAELVSQLALSGVVQVLKREAGWRVLADVHDLTGRQAKLAVAISSGSTRAEAALQVGASARAAKTDLAIVFERCGVQTAPELAKLVAELDALDGLAWATDVELRSAGEPHEPLRFVKRRRSIGRIAVEDHGPAGATPVVVIATATNGRHLPRRLVEAFHARQLRPISIERPGYGLTTSDTGNPVSDAVADIVDVLDALQLERVRVLGRATNLALALAAAHPERVRSGVLLAPAPPVPGAARQTGLLASIVTMAISRPDLAVPFARFLVRRASAAAIERVFTEVARDCAADRAVIADSVARADLVRATRQAAAGDGFSREFLLHARGGPIPAKALATPWTVLAAGMDSLGQKSVESWREALPDARVHVVPDGGRFLFISHADLVADILSADACDLPPLEHRLALLHEGDHALSGVR